MLNEPRTGTQEATQGLGSIGKRAAILQLRVFDSFVARCLLSTAGSSFNRARNCPPPSQRPPGL